MTVIAGVRTNSNSPPNAKCEASKAAPSATSPSDCFRWSSEISSGLMTDSRCSIVALVPENRIGKRDANVRRPSSLSFSTSPAIAILMMSAAQRSKRAGSYAINLSRPRYRVQLVKTSGSLDSSNARSRAISVSSGATGATIQRLSGNNR